MASSTRDVCTDHRQLTTNCHHIHTTWSRAKRHPTVIALGAIRPSGGTCLRHDEPVGDTAVHRQGAAPRRVVAWLDNGGVPSRGGLCSARRFGALGDRIGRRPLLVAGPIASCISALLIARATDPEVIIALRVLDGLGAAAIWPTAFALVGDSVEEPNRSVAMSVLNVTYMCGIALGLLLAGSSATTQGTAADTCSWPWADNEQLRRLPEVCILRRRRRLRPNRVRALAFLRKPPPTNRHPCRASPRGSAFNLCTASGLSPYDGDGFLRVLCDRAADTCRQTICNGRAEADGNAVRRDVAAGGGDTGLVGDPLGRVGDKWGKSRR